MKSSSRWLVWFGIAIGALAVLAIVLVLVSPRQASLLPEDTPEGVVQRFLLAVQENDLRTAFSYLDVVERTEKLTYDEWVKSFSPFTREQTAWKATMGDTKINGDQATVQVIVDIFRARGPFENPVDNFTVGFQLTLIGGKWFITQRPPVWYIY